MVHAYRRADIEVSELLDKTVPDLVDHARGHHATIVHPMLREAEDLSVSFRGKEQMFESFIECRKAHAFHTRAVSTINQLEKIVQKARDGQLTSARGRDELASWISWMHQGMTLEMKFLLRVKLGECTKMLCACVS